MIAPVFTGTVEKGKLRLDNVQRFRDYAATFNGEVQVTIEKRKKKRSNNQNSYYHAVIVVILSNHLGYFKDEMHEILKGKFLSRETAIKGKAYTYSRSTTDLTTVEFEEFTSSIRMWASSDLGCYIPNPREDEVNF